MTHLKKHSRPRAFSLMELMAVIGVIVLLAALSLPALRSLTKSNDQSQAANLVRSMISTARAIAISQHRQAGVVFFEETPQYSLPVNSAQTAMQLFVEDYSQPNGASTTGPLTVFIRYSSARQYLPTGVKLAALSGLATNDNMETGDSQLTLPRARTILFNGNGQLITRSGFLTPAPSSTSVTPGSYPQAYGDWNFLTAAGGQIVHFNTSIQSVLPNYADASSYPGFFLYNDTEYKAQPAANRAAWIKQNADVIIVNANTGTVIR